MDFLKALFESGALTWEQFSEAVNAKGFKLVDLSTGEYVGKLKYDNEIKAKDDSIKTLQGQLKDRDKDLETLRTQLADGNKDNETKISELTTQLEKLQGDYDTAKTQFKEQINKQNYEFAVKEFANNQKFTSNAAKRDFINEMISEGLKMKDNTIIGADDFMKVYSEANADAFVVEQPEEPAQQPEEPKPSFGEPTPPSAASAENAFTTAFGWAPPAK